MTDHFSAVSITEHVIAVKTFCVGYDYIREQPHITCFPVSCCEKWTGDEGTFQ
jgi:hypothetical protein